jgi:hypothetical protein
MQSSLFRRQRSSSTIADAPRTTSRFFLLTTRLLATISQTMTSYLPRIAMIVTGLFNFFPMFVSRLCRVLVRRHSAPGTHCQYKALGINTSDFI